MFRARSIGRLTTGLGLLAGVAACAHAADPAPKKGTPVVRVQKQRELTLSAPLDGRSYFAAASDLVLGGKFAFVVADDEFALGAFEWRTDRPGSAIPLFAGTLPADAKARKKEKPDLEACVDLGGRDGFRDLLLIPSGSRPNRMRGTFVEVSSDDGRARRKHDVDFSGLYVALGKSIVKLNIEGAAARDSRLVLLHRGNAKASRNAVIVLDRAKALAEAGTGKLTAASVKSVVPLDLGEVSGVRLTFTSASFDAEGRLWFLAAAEGGGSNYADGAIAGSLIGRLNADLNRVELAQPLEIEAKPEGLAFDPADPRKFYVVTDADDPQRRAGFYAGRVE